MKVCPHCRHDSMVKLSVDIGLKIKIKKKLYFIDFVLFVPNSSTMLVLHREVYVVE